MPTAVGGGAYEPRKAHAVLFFNTLAFTVCFAVWMLNGVLVTFLVEHDVFRWNAAQMGWLMGIPVLTGSVFRLPAGMLTDRFGGRIVFGVLLILAAIPTFLLSTADSFATYALWSFGMGLVGTSFAIGIAYTSVWYPMERQGLALGIFGAGNAGAAVTTLVGPRLLDFWTRHGSMLEGWRTLPRACAVMLVITGVVFLAFTHTRVLPGVRGQGPGRLLLPLRSLRVWRFGLYYFLVFGCFVAFSQWLVPYLVGAYGMTLVAAGAIASMFSLPSGVIRALGGWVSDRWGARTVMYWVLGTSLATTLLLCFPRMEITSPGKGVAATRGGVVTAVNEREVRVGEQTYPLRPRPAQVVYSDDRILVWPSRVSWQEPVVRLGDRVKRKQLLARGVTHIYFQANVWIFAGLVILVGVAWGIGKAAVYKYIPDYFPRDVGVVGGMVGVLGGLGGFFGPVIFGYLLEWSGLWSSCWWFLFVLSAGCLLWMLRTVQQLMLKRVPRLMRELEARTLVCPVRGVEVEIETETVDGVLQLRRCSLMTGEVFSEDCPPSCGATCLQQRSTREDKRP
ncbi:MAG: MFS transporter [Candidatus Eremiobacterota bacterium]